MRHRYAWCAQERAAQAAQYVVLLPEIFLHRCRLKLLVNTLSFVHRLSWFNSTASVYPPGFWEPSLLSKKVAGQSDAACKINAGFVNIPTITGHDK
jgi:hypothetical protein